MILTNFNAEEDKSPIDESDKKIEVQEDEDADPTSKQSTSKKEEIKELEAEVESLQREHDERKEISADLDSIILARKRHLANLNLIFHAQEIRIEVWRASLERRDTSTKALARIIQAYALSLHQDQ